LTKTYNTSNTGSYEAHKKTYAHIQTPYTIVIM